MKHAKYSPSAYHRWKRCPASINYNESEKTVDSLKGDFIHNVLNHVLTLGLSVQEAFESLEKNVEIEIDEVSSVVEVVLNYIQQRQEELNYMCEVKSEVKVVYSNDCWGSCDVLIESFDFVEIIDLKTGFNPVEVVDNDQLLLYALAIHTTYPNFSKFKMTIVQPNNVIHGRDTVNSWDCDIKRLQEEEEILKQAMIKAGEDEYNASKIACSYCPFKGQCQALLDKTFELLECSTLSEQLGLKDVRSMTNSQIAEVLENESLIKKFLKSVEKEAINRIVEGGFVAGYKVVNSIGNRSWSIPEEELVEKFKKLGIPKGEMYKQTILSPSQLKSLKWGDGKKLSVKQLQIMEEYVERKEGGYKLVDIKSKEQSINDVIENYFKEIS